MKNQIMAYGDQSKMKRNGHQNNRNISALHGGAANGVSGTRSSRSKRVARSRARHIGAIAASHRASISARKQQSRNGLAARQRMKMSSSIIISVAKMKANENIEIINNNENISIISERQYQHQ
jgi:hypothetical protein